MTEADPLHSLRGRGPGEHRALVLRALGLGEPGYQGVLRAFSAGVGEGASAGERLALLASVFRASSPHEAPLPSLGPAGCGLCGGEIRPSVARQVAGGEPLVYGLCGGCGHGRLLSGEAPSSIYGAGYHQAKSAGGAGYDGYGAEAAYREAKAERLLGWAGEPPVPTRNHLLEIGSGYGFARAAAERLGYITSGVDLSPAAADEARRRYGLSTLVGTLGEALSRGALPERSFDLVLYQFVLEHVREPLAELRLARQALAPGGRVLLVVPSMAAAERAAFGAAYRSLRADHLHLFSPLSLSLAAGLAGLQIERLESGCNLHLLADFVPEPHLVSLYQAGLGPDLTVLLKESSPCASPSS